MNIFKQKGVSNARYIATLAVLTALVVILQIGLGSITIGGTSFSVVLVPIVLGSLMLGATAGGFLGFVFSLIVFIYGLTGVDVFTNVMINASLPLTMLICFAKGVLAGVVPALIFGATKERNVYLAVILAALSAPVINTGLFVGGMLLFSGVYTQAMTAFYTIDSSADYIYFVIMIIAGVNFLVEFAVNAILIPVIHTIVRLFEKRFLR